MKHPSILVWLRRDLRLDDNSALTAALADAQTVWCAFVFDRTILDPLPDRADRRVEFIWQAVNELERVLRARGAGLLVLHSDPADCIPALAKHLSVGAVYINRDYEPAARVRDRLVANELAQVGATLVSFKDQVVFETDEVLSQAGKPFSVFTPYKNAWLRKLTAQALAAHEPAPEAAARLANTRSATVASIYAQYRVPSLESLGFCASGLEQLKVSGGSAAAQALFVNFSDRIGQYQIARDFPAIKGPSYLSVHLRFGTISVRQLARFAFGQMNEHASVAAGARTWLSELIWRDFYFQILHHHPHVVQQCFKPEFDALQWDQNPAFLAAWQQGETGYPLVDAAMMQLNQTGYMHNRLRMVVASFLTKDLGLDWRTGEAYFARKLIDFDLSANNGGWQWAASTGCDAQPWFRIFNPITQSQRFDPQGKFIRRYLPQLANLSDKEIHAPWLVPAPRLAQAGVSLTQNYPLPLIDHAQARARTLQRFGLLKPAAEKVAPA